MVMRLPRQLRQRHKNNIKRGGGYFDHPHSHEIIGYKADHRKHPTFGFSLPSPKRPEEYNFLRDDNALQNVKITMAQKEVIQSMNGKKYKPSQEEQEFLNEIKQLEELANKFPDISIKSPAEKKRKYINELIKIKHKMEKTLFKTIDKVKSATDENSLINHITILNSMMSVINKVILEINRIAPSNEEGGAMGFAKLQLKIQERLSNQPKQTPKKKTKQQVKGFNSIPVPAPSRSTLTSSSTTAQTTQIANELNSKIPSNYTIKKSVDTPTFNQIDDFMNSIPSIAPLWNVSKKIPFTLAWTIYHDEKFFNELKRQLNGRDPKTLTPEERKQIFLNALSTYKQSITSQS